MDIKTKIITFVQPMKGLKKAIRVRKYLKPEYVERLNIAKQLSKERNSPVIITFKMHKGRLYDN